MRLLASLLLVAVPAIAQEPPPGEEPRGSSQREPGERRLDEVAQAALSDRLMVRGLGTGDAAELTALDSGRTIVVAVTATAAPTDPIVALSPATAAALMLPAGGAVRARRAVVLPEEQAQLRRGEIVARVDAPPPLLAGLRSRLPIGPATKSTSAVSGSAKAVATGRSPAAIAAGRAAARGTAKPASTGAFWVQVASLSSESGARALAAKVGGAVTPMGRLYRVRIGPLSDHGAAQRAQARARSLGYRDAVIVRPEQ